MNVIIFNCELFDFVIVFVVEFFKLFGNEDMDVERVGRMFREYDIELMKMFVDVWGDDKFYGVVIK